jgi:hypothetical protein
MAKILVPSQYSTIQAAITACASGDEIIVSAGTYNETLTFTSKNRVLVRAATGETVIVTNTGVLVTLPSTCYYITMQGIKITKTGSAASVLVDSLSSAASGCKFIDCTFDVSAWTGVATTSPMILLYPGDSNAPSLIRRCTFIGRGAAQFGSCVTWSTIGAANQSILCESNFVYNYWTVNDATAMLFNLNGGASASGHYVARNNTFLSCKAYRRHIQIQGGLTALASCYNNVFQSSTFWNTADINDVFVALSSAGQYCGYNTGHNNVITERLAYPDSAGNSFVSSPGLHATTGIPTAATSAVYRTGVTLSGQGERRVMLGQSRVPFAATPSRGAFETWFTGKGFLYIKWVNVNVVGGLTFNMTGQTAPTLPTDLLTFDSPMEVAEYIERSIQHPKGLEYGPIEVWYDFENNRYRMSCYQSSFVLATAGGIAALIGTHSLSGQTDTG